MQENGQKETDKVQVSLYNKGTINKNKVVIETLKGTLRLWFSYQTIVGFEVNSKIGKYNEGTITNQWSNTTGRLLNELQPDKSLRLEPIKFRDELSKAMEWVF